MQFILDNLSAQIIAAGMIVMLMGINVRGQRASQEVANFYALRQQQLTFVDFMKRDMRNVTAVQTVAEGPLDHAFRFQARTIPGSSAVQSVSYRRVWVRNVDGVDQYRIDRYVDGVLSGGSMSTLTAWSIRARNAEGGPVEDPAHTRMIQIAFEADNPFEGGETVERARWEGSFRPPLIQQIVNL